MEQINQQNCYITNKYSYLILGGLGYIGKAFVQYLYENEAYDKIVVVDKTIPQIAYIPKGKEDIFRGKVQGIKCIQADLANEEQMNRVFGEEGPFQIVINLAAETKYGLKEQEYIRNTVKVIQVCAKISANNNVQRYIDISTTRVYESSYKKLNEMGNIEPWTQQAIHKYLGEEIIKKIPNLQWNILRLGLVYGPYDTKELASLLATSTICSVNNETLKMLWDSKIKVNTIHIHDVCRALGFLIQKSQPFSMYNLVDDGDTTYGDIVSIISELFNIQVKFAGKVKTLMAKIFLDGIISAHNNKYLKNWLELTQSFGVTRTPIEVTVYKELLEGKSNCIDNTALKKIGFQCIYSKITKELVHQQILSLIEQGLFPNAIQFLSQKSLQNIEQS